MIFTLTTTAVTCHFKNVEGIFWLANGQVAVTRMDYNYNVSSDIGSFVLKYHYCNPLYTMYSGLGQNDEQINSYLQYWFPSIGCAV